MNLIKETFLNSINDSACLTFTLSPMLLLSSLYNVQQGGVDALKSVKTILWKGSFFDEMYMQKSAQYQSGEYVGVDEEGNLFKGIVAFMLVGLKQSTEATIRGVL